MKVIQIKGRLKDMTIKCNMWSWTWRQIDREMLQWTLLGQLKKLEYRLDKIAIWTITYFINVKFPIFDIYTVVM